MRKQFNFLFISLLFFFCSDAQTTWGIKAGIAINKQNSFQGADKSALITEQASFFKIIPVHSSFILQPSIGYYPKGGRINNMTFEDQFGNPIGVGSLSFRFDYVELTIPFQYLLTRHTTKLYSGIGPYLSYAISGKEKWRNVSGTSSNESNKGNIPFGSNGYKRVDAGFVIIFSALLKGKWIFSATYEAGFLNIYYSSQNETNNFSGGLTIGYCFK